MGVTALQVEVLIAKKQLLIECMDLCYFNFTEIKLLVSEIIQ
jgi:hypothetical protein